MIRSLSLLRTVPPWLGAALALTLAIGAGLLLAQLLMAPPAGDLQQLAAYLALSGAATLGLGWLALRAADRGLGLSLRTKAFLGTAIGMGIALLNVFVVAQLMFISTSHDLKLLVALLVFSGLVTLLFSLWAADSISRSVERIVEAVHVLAAGDYRARVEVPAGDEVARLAESLNRLAARLQDVEDERQALDRERRELTAAISHDLRTPLASIRAMVEALDDDVVSSRDEVRRYYGAMRRQIEQLSRMIEDLFELAQIDSGALRLERRPLALQDVAAEVVDAMQAQAGRRGVRLSCQVLDGVADLLLDGGRIERAVSNLVQNALEHTPAGGTVQVMIAGSDGWAELRVIDAGEGIDSADLPRIWDRFYRAEKSRRREANGGDGRGLGLAIVRGLVEAHGGSVSAASVAGRGTTITIRLPADPAG